MPPAASKSRCSNPRPLRQNWGLHDVCPLVKPQLAQAGSGYAAVTEAQYVANLEALYQQLKRAVAPKGTLIWCSTTPVPITYRGRNNSDVVLINKLARTLFGPGSEHPEVLVHDLYTEVVDKCRADFPKSASYPQGAACAYQNNGVHFGHEGENSTGKRLTASWVVDAIKPHLKKPA